jgi:kynurenine formamidase
MSELPTFSELPYLGDTGERHAWNVFGVHDQIGTINLLTQDRVKAASRLIRTGGVISLNLPLDFPISPYDTPTRTGYKHHIEISRSGRDDILDQFALQGSTQWDGLRHVRFRQFGYYGGRQDRDLDEQGELGIEHWAKHGIVGRGILLDAVAYMMALGTPLTPNVRFAMDGSFLESVAKWEQVEIKAGDILLLRTGWLTWYKQLNAIDRDKLKGTLHPGQGGMACPGIDGHQATAAWLWNHQLAAVAADNVALEALPVEAKVGFQHRRLIALQGMAIGELWDLDALAHECREDGFYEFMLMSGLLSVPGGVGSPANAYAIR